MWSHERLLSQALSTWSFRLHRSALFFDMFYCSDGRGIYTRSTCHGGPHHINLRTRLSCDMFSWLQYSCLLLPYATTPFASVSPLTLKSSGCLFRKALLISIWWSDQRLKEARCERTRRRVSIRVVSAKTPV